MIGTPARGRVLAAAVLLLGLAGISGASATTATRVAGPSLAARTVSPTSILASGTTRAAATWCGTPSEVDARPNGVAGHPVHWVYVVPSDGQDRFSTFASVMQTDAETMDTWWRGQDSTRAPRGDLAQFPCGLQLDLSSVRMSQSSAQLSAPESPFDPIWNTLVARGFNSNFTKYVVYYDGPVGNVNICGAGGTTPGRLGMAMVFVQSCAGVSSAEVVTHELLHAMGAVPVGAPHMCPPPDGGHTCDNDRDLMFPFSDGTPLPGLSLDPGRDDYYAHSGSWPDLQDSPWLVQLDRQAALGLAISGPGKVVADLPGLDCERSCSTTWNTGTQIVLTPTPNPGAKLVRWSGGCSGASQCALTIGQGSAATALFAPVTYRLSVRVSGRGSIRSATGSIACPGRCASVVASHAPLRLTATPVKGWMLKAWTGSCRGKRRVCTVPMTSNTSARAVFVRT